MERFQKAVIWHLQLLFQLMCRHDQIRCPQNLYLGIQYTQAVCFTPYLIREQDVNYQLRPMRSTLQKPWLKSLSIKAKYPSNSLMKTYTFPKEISIQKQRILCLSDKIASAFFNKEMLRMRLQTHKNRRIFTQCLHKAAKQDTGAQTSCKDIKESSRVFFAVIRLGRATRMVLVLT